MHLGWLILWQLQLIVGLPVCQTVAHVSAHRAEIKRPGQWVHTPVAVQWKLRAYAKKKKRCKIDQTQHLNDAATTSLTRKTSPYVLIHNRERESTTPPSDLSAMCWKDHNGTHYSVASANNPHRTRRLFCILLKMAENSGDASSTEPRVRHDVQTSGIISRGSVLRGNIIRKRLWGGNTWGCGSIQQSRGCTLTLSHLPNAGRVWLELPHFYQPCWQVAISPSVLFFFFSFTPLSFQELIWFQRTAENTRNPAATVATWPKG